MASLDERVSGVGCEEEAGVLGWAEQAGVIKLDEWADEEVCKEPAGVLDQAEWARCTMTGWTMLLVEEWEWS